jgi:hypothetical protein
MGEVKRMRFKKHDMCLMITAVIRDSEALDFITKENMTKWGHTYQKDDDDKAVEATLLFERLYLANHIALNYDERHGLDVRDSEDGLDCSTFAISLCSIKDLLSSNEWRQLEDIELLEMLTRLRESVFSPNKVICLANESDVRQLELLILYYYDKLLLRYLAKEELP